jgi:hypothetical protein
MVATVFCAVLLSGGKRRLPRALTAAAVFGLLSLAIFSFWLARNWIFMGNVSQALFRTPGGVDAPQMLEPALGKYFQALLELPARLWHGVWVISQSGNSPPLLLVFAIGLRFALRDRDPRRGVLLIFAVLHLLLFALTLPMQDGRYILPGMAVAVIVFFHYVERLLANFPQYRGYLVGGVLALGLLNFGMAKYRLDADYGESPWPLYTRGAYEAFLTRHHANGGNLDSWMMVKYINTRLPAGSKVLLEDMTRPLYIWRPFMARNDMDPPILNTFIRRTRTDAELLDRLRAYGLTHILTAGDFASEPGIPPHQLTEAQRRRLDEFIARNLERVHKEGRHSLYRILGAAGPFIYLQTNSEADELKYQEAKNEFWQTNYGQTN